MIDPLNISQAQAWDGAEGSRWTQDEERYDSSAAAHAAHLLRAAAIRPDDRVLDIGCGCGRLTREAAAVATRGNALGVDLSEQMLTRARQRAAQDGLNNLTFRQGDAQVYRFVPSSFDVVVSKYGAMFFADPVTAFTNIGRAVRPGGRLAMLVWRELGVNPWVSLIRVALAGDRQLPDPPANGPGPFGFADPNHIRSVLARSGWSDTKLTEIVEPVWLGNDPDDAFAFVSQMGITLGLLEGLDRTSGDLGMQRLRATLHEAMTDIGVSLPSRSWLIEASRP